MYHDGNLLVLLTLGWTVAVTNDDEAVRDFWLPADSRPLGAGGTP